MSRSALLVIDVQQSFLQAPYFNASDMPLYQAKQIELITACQRQHIPVIRIFHVEKTGHFSKASGWVKPMDFLPPHHGLEFEKTVHNALLGSGLHEYLQQQGIQHLIISGIRTEQCCETTARVGSDLGYSIDFVTEATLTFAMQHANGQSFSAKEIKTHTELVLSGRFARICSIEQLIASWPALAHA
ncbi:isochorismatase family protein [Deefgea piscis]|uniref:isochorismatase family protein n=1 Tax=Deefgea piscis TaxID=2739061 RepID=UPI001C7F7242|nr:isochorismatase family protein [Deefgea piscis]QZA82466.1 isochorismatase family protein [Deefgea piscis]